MNRLASRVQMFLVPANPRSWERLSASPTLRLLCALTLGSLALTFSARLQVPMWPVPMTMQSLVVVLLGVVLGPYHGVAAVMSYLLQGLLGLQVFANPVINGPAYFMGPTGGFLLAFVPAALIAGFLSRPGSGWLRIASGMLVAHVVILLVGMLWLGLVSRLPSGQAGVGMRLAWERGVSPFLVGSAVKSALAVMIVLTVRRYRSGG